MVPLKARGFAHNKRWEVIGKLLVVVILIGPLWLLLSRLGTDRVGEAISKLKHPDPKQRLHAMYSLEPGDWPFNKAEPRAVEALISELRDTDPGNRERAARDLGNIKDPLAVEPLIAEVKDADPAPRSSAVCALGEIGDSRAVEPLVAELEDNESRVRGCAALGLCKLKGQRAADSLLAELKTHGKAFREVYGAMIGQGNAPEDALIAALNQFGDKEMAESFLSSHNLKLNEAARDWAGRNGYSIQRLPQSPF